MDLLEKMMAIVSEGLSQGEGAQAPLDTVTVR